MRAGLTLLLCTAGTVIGGKARKPTKYLQDQDHTSERTGLGLLGRVFRQAKRIGDIIDPDAVAEAEQAWKEFQELAPDLREAVDEILQSKEDVLAAVKEARDIWFEDKEHASGFGRWERDKSASSAQEEESSARFGWEGLQKDFEQAAAGLFGDVLGEATDEILATFEASVSEALSEGNVRAASQLWRRSLDTPGVQLLSKDRRLWAGLERALRQYLSGFLSERSATEAQRAINATADFSLHFAGLSRNAAKSDLEVFEELSRKLCHLQGAAEKLWPLAVGALPLLGYEDYAARAEGAIRSKALSRITQTVSASALLGLDPRDPFLVTVIAAFALGHLSKDIAHNMAAFFQKVLMEQVTFNQQTIEQRSSSNAEGRGAPMNPVDLATQLVAGTNSCEELGHQAFAFFKAVQRALAESPPPTHEGVEVSEQVEKTAQEASFTAPQVSEQLSTPRVPRELKLDGILLQQAIWVAAVVDNERFSLDVFFACLVVGFLLCGASASVCLWRGLGKLGRCCPIRKGEEAPHVSVAKREKTA